MNEIIKKFLFIISIGFFVLYVAPMIIFTILTAFITGDTFLSIVSILIIFIIFYITQKYKEIFQHYWK